MSALPLLSRGGRSDEIRGVAAMTRDVCRARGPGLWRCPRRPAAARQPLLYAVLVPVGALRRATTGLGKRDGRQASARLARRAPPDKGEALADSPARTVPRHSPLWPSSWW